MKQLLYLPSSGYVLLNFDSQQFEHIIVPKKINEKYLEKKILLNAKTFSDVEINVETILNFLDYFAVEKEKMTQLSHQVKHALEQIYTADLGKQIVKYVKINKKITTDNAILSNPNISQEYCLKNAVEVAKNYGLPESFFR